MLDDKIATVKQAAEAWNRDDLDAFLDLLDPDLEWHPSIEPFFEGTESVIRGHDGAREGWKTYRGEAVERLEIRYDEFRDLGESLLGLGEIKIIGHTSQAEFTSEIVQLLTFRGGKIASAHDFLSHAEGLKAAGLSE